MLRIFIVGAAIVVALVVAKRDHWFERAGLVGSCRIVASPTGDSAQWWSCRQGVMTGYPVLSRQQCDNRGIALNREFWRCPTPLETTPGAVF
jgi:hypothetical protein